MPRYPRLRRRARRISERELRPLRRRTDREIGRIERQGSRAARGQRGTSQAAAGYYTRAAQNLGRGVADRGLLGNQLEALGAQTARYGEGLATLAQRASRQDVRGLRQDYRQQLVDTRRATFQSLVGERQKAAQEAAEAGVERREARHERRAEGLDAAAGHYLDVIKAGAPAPQSDQQWGQFQQAFEQANPLMSPEQVARAIAQLRARLVTQRPAGLEGGEGEIQRGLGTSFLAPFQTPSARRGGRRALTRYFLGR